MNETSQKIWSFSRTRLYYRMINEYCCAEDTYYEIKYITSIHHTDSFSNNNVVDGIVDVLDDE